MRGERVGGKGRERAHTSRKSALCKVLYEKHFSWFTICALKTYVFVRVLQKCRDKLRQVNFCY